MMIDLKELRERLKPTIDNYPRLKVTIKQHLDDKGEPTVYVAQIHTPRGAGMVAVTLHWVWMDTVDWDDIRQRLDEMLSYEEKALDEAALLQMKQERINKGDTDLLCVSDDMLYSEYQKLLIKK